MWRCRACLGLSLTSVLSIHASTISRTTSSIPSTLSGFGQSLSLNYARSVTTKARGRTRPDSAPPRSVVPSRVGVGSKRPGQPHRPSRMGPVRPGRVTSVERQQYKELSGRNSTGKLKLINSMDGKLPSQVDPMKFAIEIRTLLREGSLEKAQNKVRTATVPTSKLDTIAGWNEVISHLMEVGNVSGAFKAYNEMKKRGGKPNEHTYTILLSGLADERNAHHPSTMERAMKVYRSIVADDGHTKANIIHVNAMLKVCTRTGSLDTMWEVLGELPPKGPRKPNAQTYTTFFSGLRSMRGAGGRELQQQQQQQEQQQEEIQKHSLENSIEDAKRLWAGILSQWNNGTLNIDEKLINSYGRLLLSSTREEDWREVPTLGETLFKIPDFTLNREMRHFTRDASTSVWKPKNALTAGNAILSLLLDTVAHLKLPPATAAAYWRYFDEHVFHDCPPDVEAHLSYLRALRRVRAGTEAAQFLRETLKGAPTEIVQMTSTHRSVKDRALPRDDTSAVSLLPATQQVVRCTHYVQPSNVAFKLALSCCKRAQGGRTTTFPAAQSVLDIFDAVYKQCDVPLPVRAVGRLGKALRSREAPLDPALIYSEFLEVANLIGDVKIWKRALRRATAEDCTAASLIGPDILPQGTVLKFVDSILHLGQKILASEDATWGHGERESLIKNLKFLTSLKRQNTSMLTARGGLAGNRRSFAASSLGADEEEETADAWTPSSAKDRGRKRTSNRATRARS